MERLINKTKELKNYEKKFNLLKSENKNNSNLQYDLDFKINYNTEDYMLNFNINKLHKFNNIENLFMILRKELEDLDKFENIKITSIDDLKSKVNYLFFRYNKIIKYVIEDNWALYTPESNQTKYELKNNEFIFDNSILIKNKEDPNLIYFLKRLFKISSILAKKINYKVYTKFYDDEYHEICWLIFVFAKN